MEKRTSDHILSVIKAGVSSVPVVGGPLSSLISDYVPSSTQKAIEGALRELQQRLKVVEGRIDVEAVDKDEFVDLFKSCYIAIVRTTQRQKHSIAVGLLLNILLKRGDSGKLSFTELDHFSRCLDGLSMGALEVLGVMYRFFQRMKRPKLITFRTLLPEFEEGTPLRDPELLMGVIGELNMYNLTHMPAVPMAQEEKYANYAIRITPLGMKFVESLQIGKAES